MFLTKTLNKMKQIKNLYKIEFKHFAPKGSERGIKTLILANNDDEIYQYLLNDGVFYPEDYEDKKFEDNAGKSETFKERMIRIKGLLNDENYEITDTYYGVTLIGWSLVKENVETDYSELLELGLMVDLT